VPEGRSALILLYFVARREGPLPTGDAAMQIPRRDGGRLGILPNQVLNGKGR
jgi:hypothetical protein